MLALYLYDHGNLSMATRPFICAWDSGQAGWIYVTKEQIKKEYGVDEVTQELLARVESVLEGEVRTYDDYLTGNVHGYSVEIFTESQCKCCGSSLQHSEFDDSCWGFYGVDRMIQEVNAMLKKYDVVIA